MWPSMKSGPVGDSRERDSILEELLAPDPSPASHRDSEDEDDCMEPMQELLRHEEQNGRDTCNGVLKISTEGSFPNTLHPWLTPNSGKTGGSIFSGMSLTPDTEVAFPFGMKEDETATSVDKNFMGFEDNFTVFVSAPAEDYQDCETTPDAISYYKQQDTLESPMIPSSTLEPESAGVRYHSLGSVSDFGDEEAMLYESLDDGEDDDLPTKEEIRETSAKIFGSVPFSLEKKKEMGIVTDGNGVSPEGGTLGQEDFDLSQVMSALEQFKSDISGIDNDEERRKAAAKVALGLVYGLVEH